jgi:hypothetical protein
MALAISFAAAVMLAPRRREGVVEALKLSFCPTEMTSRFFTCGLSNELVNVT